MIGRAVVRVVVYVFVIVVCFLVGVLAKGLWVAMGFVFRRTMGFVKRRRTVASGPPLRVA